MTNYNERLDELITSCDFEPEAPYSRICKWCGEAKGTSIHTTKQAITSLIKELVAEAKPINSKTQRGSITVYGDMSERDLNTINQFEQNLLKALETLE